MITLRCSLFGAFQVGRPNAMVNGSSVLATPTAASLFGAQQSNPDLSFSNPVLATGVGGGGVPVVPVAQQSNLDLSFSNPVLGACPRSNAYMLRSLYFYVLSMYI